MQIIIDINISIKRTSKRILSPFTECKNGKLGIRLEKNINGRKKTKFRENRQRIILQSRGMVRKILR